MAESDGVDRIVEQWARERPDLDTTAMAVFGRIYRLARVSGDEVEKAYARYGIGRPEFDVLATLRRSGAPYELTAGALLKAAMVTSGAITNRIDRMEAVIESHTLPAAQVRAARFRVTRDAARGRPTPDRIARLARVVLPGEHPAAAH